MADFREAFLQGLAAYDDAERARKEIFGLLDEFAEQVEQASAGRVRIERSKGSETSGHILGALSPAGPLRTREYDALFARRPSGEQREKLCEYSLSDRGYPVTLRYAKEDVSCHDGQGLERGLRHLLAHPETGGKLQRLMGTEQAA